MSDDETEPAPAAAPAPPGPSASEPMDINKAVWGVLKTALAHDGLARGLREACRALENGEALMCILAEDCDQPDYKKLIDALCSEKDVNLISVPTKAQLGEWAGLCKLDSEGQARKVVGCSCCVITNYGEETEYLHFLQEELKGGQASKG